MNANVKVHIGELVVSGQHVVDPAALGAAVQRELTRLLSQRHIRVATTSRARVDAGTIAATDSAQALGRHVARATYNVLRSRS
jgi:hypothetical protein